MRVIYTISPEGRLEKFLCMSGKAWALEQFLATLREGNYRPLYSFRLKETS